MAKELILTKTNGSVRVSENLNEIVANLRDGKYRLIIKKFTEKRSLDQNALMWLWFEYLYRETGTAKEDFYSYYCKQFLGRTVHINGMSIRVNDTTSTLTKEQMTHFLNEVQADVAIEFGINLPLPQDQFYSEFITQYEK